MKEACEDPAFEAALNELNKSYEFGEGHPDHALEKFWETAVAHGRASPPVLQPMETAPEYFMIHLENGLAFPSTRAKSVDSDGMDCETYAEIHEGTSPECWTDGMFWAVNENDEESLKPIGWSPIPKKRCAS